MHVLVDKIPNNEKYVHIKCDKALFICPKVEQELDFFTYILLDTQYIMSENCMDCHFNSRLIPARINRDYTDVTARRRELLLEDCEYLETWPPSVWTGFTLLTV